MKYLAALIILLSVYSCKKDESKACWTCHITQDEPKTGWDTAYTIPVCDRTPTEMSKDESDFSSFTATRNGIDPVNQSMHCDRN